MDDVTVESVLDKIKSLLSAEIDRAATIGMLGGDVGVADDDRARWNAAPDIQEIERDLETLSRSMAAYDG